MVILTSSIVVIAYMVLLPLILNTYSPAWIAWHVCYGHWNLIMIAFHYYKAANTSPGYLPAVRYQLSFLCHNIVLLIWQSDKDCFVFLLEKTRQSSCFSLQKVHFS